MRAANSCQNSVARPQAMVARLQKAMPATSRLRRLVRSATQPRGIPATAYIEAKAMPWIRLTCVSLTPRSAFSDGSSRVTIWRSRKAITQARNRTEIR
jgi:hypothetical protein